MTNLSINYIPVSEIKKCFLSQILILWQIAFCMEGIICALFAGLINTQNTFGIPGPPFLEPSYSWKTVPFNTANENYANIVCNNKNNNIVYTSDLIVLILFIIITILLCAKLYYHLLELFSIQKIKSLYHSRSSSLLKIKMPTEAYPTFQNINFKHFCQQNLFWDFSIPSAIIVISLHYISTIRLLERQTNCDIKNNINSLHTKIDLYAIKFPNLNYFYYKITQTALKILGSNNILFHKNTSLLPYCLSYLTFLVFISPIFATIVTLSTIWFLNLSKKFREQYSAAAKIYHI